MAARIAGLHERLSAADKHLAELGTQTPLSSLPGSQPAIYDDYVELASDMGFGPAVRPVAQISAGTCTVSRTAPGPPRLKPQSVVFRVPAADRAARWQQRRRCIQTL